MSEPDPEVLHRAGEQLDKLMQLYSMPSNHVINAFRSRKDGTVVLGLSWSAEEIAKHAHRLPDEIEGVPVRFVHIPVAQFAKPSECARYSIEELQRIFCA